MALVQNGASPSTCISCVVSRHLPCDDTKFVSPDRLSFGSHNAVRSRAASLLSLALPAKVGDALQDSKGWDKSTTVVEQPDERLEIMDPDFYRIGYNRYVRAYGVEFKEGSKGIGVYAAKDIPKLKTARIIMEIPMELMVTVSKELPWMFHPDIVPLGHPLFEIINSTNPETDWDLRLACLLLLALDQDENFWQQYSDYLPANDEMTSLLLATEDELVELHDEELADFIRCQKQRVVDFWKQNWKPETILKVKRLARQADQLLWAVGVAWSRKFMMTMTIGTKVQDAHMLIPYADMLNHSFQPTCSYQWRKKDRMLEVVMNPHQSIKQGDEMTLNYAHLEPTKTFMKFYGFSSPENPFDMVKFSGIAKIHRESFLSAFNLAGLDDELYYNERAAIEVDGFVDGAVLAAARTLPTWSDGDLPFLPSQEIKAARELQHECQQILERYPTTLEEDRQTLDLGADRGVRWRAAVKYRIDRKLLVQKIIQALDLYVRRIIF